MTTARGLTRRVSLGLLGALATPWLARAQSDYPSRIVKLIVPYAAGGSSDAESRWRRTVHAATWQSQNDLARPGSTGSPEQARGRGGTKSGGNCGKIPLKVIAVSMVFLPQ
jgi:uncharacterized protein YPO0396